MKKIVIGVLLSLTLIGVLSYIFLNQASADVTHDYEHIGTYKDDDGLDIVVWQLFFGASGSSLVNHVEGYLDFVGYDLISFEVKDDFVKDNFIEVERNNNSDIYEFSLTSNNTYDSSDGKVFYATVTFKQTGEYPCHINFAPMKASKVNTNDLYLEKTAVKTEDSNEEIYEVNSNEEFYYKITVANYSVIPTDDVTLTDTIPEEFTIIDADGGTVNNQTITWNIGSMRVDEELTFYVLVKALENNDDIDLFTTNVATVEVGDNVLREDADVNILHSNINITKEASVREIKPGDSFTYTITITNDGTGLSNNIILTDTLDSDLTLNSASASYQKSGNTYTFQIDPLEAGEEYELTLNVTLNNNSTKDNIVNTAIATESNKDPVDDSTTTPVINSHIIIEKTASTKTLRPGETFTYEIKVTNNGDAPSNAITIRDTLDSRLELLQASTGSITGNTFTHTINTLGINESTTIRLTAKVLETTPSGVSINNIATATEEQKDPVSAEEEVNVVDSTVTITKTSSKRVVNVGEEFAYTITINNTSDYDSKELTLTDTINNNLTILSAPGSNINGQTITYNVGILKAHETKSFEIIVRANDTTDNTTINNVAILKEPGKPDIEDNTTITVVKPILSVTKNAQTSTGTNIVRPNEEYTYEIVVRNNGNGDAENVSITDTISSYLTVIDADGASVSNQTLTWTTDIASGESITYQIRVRVNNNVSTNTVIPNEVIVTYEDEELKDDEDVTVTDANIILEKKASVNKVKKGESFYYTITISNVGNDTATNLYLNDYIPNEITITSIDADYEVNFTSSSNDEGETFSNFDITIPSISPDETIEIIVYATVKDNVSENDIITNKVTLTYDDKELESSADVIVIDSNLIVKKVASKTNVSKGEEFTYTITISNNGEAEAQNIVVIDTFDEYLEIIDSDNGLVDNESHTITWNIASINAGSTVSLNIIAKVKDDITKDSVLNEVLVREPDKPDKEDEVKVDVGKPTLTITKESNKQEVTKGGEYEYTITIKNTSDINATNISVTDTFDERLIIVESDGTIKDNTITWNFDLASNSSITFKVKVRVKEDVGNGKIPNIAILHNDEDIPSNEVIVEIVEVVNPATGNIIKYSFITVCIILTAIIIIYTKKKRKIFKI